MDSLSPMHRAAIVVAGGAGRRLGFAAKPWLLVAGRPMVDHVLHAARAHASCVVLVGQPPARWSAPEDVIVTMEDPAGGGPAAAVCAGMAMLPAAVQEVLLCAGDAPFIASPLTQLLHTSMPRDGVAITSDGTTQFLLSRIRRGPLEVALAKGGNSLRSVFDHLQIDTVEAQVRDADTWEDVAHLRTEGGAMNEQAWLDEVSALLGVNAKVDIDAVLALARDVAHGRERKYAPLTAYLLGYAAAEQHLDPARIAELASKIGTAASAPTSTQGE